MLGTPSQKDIMPLEVVSKNNAKLSLRSLPLFIGLFVLIVGALSFMYFSRTVDDGGLRMIRVGTTDVLVGIADSPVEREQGLSGRPSLPRDEGLLFLFGQPDRQAFWMKDMLFPIDILWFDVEGRLAYAAESVSPSTYPDTFSPDVPSLYVLEVPAGFVKEKNIKIGDLLSF